MKLANVKIGKKLGLLITGVLFQMACLTGVAVWGIRAVDSSMDAGVKEGHTKAVALTEWS